jgi:two-component system nitrogen regulation response regulator NtrX
MTIQDLVSTSGIVSESPLMREVVGHIQKAAASTAGVMVSGEPGTGRGFVARAIHACAGPDGAPFVSVDGHAVLAAEAERAIFGVPGNGHGNVAPRPPRAPEVVYSGSFLHDSLGGTVFFRHLEGLPARVQARLATLLRDREFVERPRGEALPFTARPVAAVDPDYQSHVEDGRVRLDLHRRFAEFRIAMPALRERRDDIPGLAQFFVAHACREHGTSEKTLDDGAQAVLSAMPWRGNSRELRVLLEGLVRSTPDGAITLQVLLDHISLMGPGGEHPGLGEPLRVARARFEREYIAAVVAQHHGRIPDAAKSLGIQRTNLYRKLRALRLARPDGGWVFRQGVSSPGRGGSLL